MTNAKVLLRLVTLALGLAVCLPCLAETPQLLQQRLEDLRRIDADAATRRQETVFAVFFSDGAGFGIEMLQALNAAHTQDITRAQHQQGRLSAVAAELLHGQDRHKLLQSWLNGESGDGM